MKLKDLLKEIYDGQFPKDKEELEITSVVSDSRQAKKGSIFVALKGPDNNGADFITDAIKKGSSIVVCDEMQKKNLPDNICSMYVKDTKIFLNHISKRFYGNPSEKIKAIAVTGTNGKTTISYLLESILNCVGKKCGVIGTVNYRIGNNIIPAKNTTPGLLDIQRYFSEMVNQGIGYCVIETSSHALEQRRVDPADFSAGIFTNLTGDHLDYHETMEEYFQAKLRLFRHLPNKAHAIINIDDEYGKRIIPDTRAKVKTYGLSRQADVYAENISVNLSFTSFVIKTYGNSINIRTKLIGRHNVANILAAASYCIAEGIKPEHINQGIANLQCVPGRLEKVPNDKDFTVFVDYAHTHDALHNVLANIKSVSDSRIILVFGCGGDRDKSKRPKMAKVASDLADFSIVTNDNPRNEDPEAISKEVIEGFENDKYSVCLDREKAIKTAISKAKSGDIVLIAGKGHEDYQIFGDKKIHFDDREVAKKYL